MILMIRITIVIFNTLFTMYSCDISGKLGHGSEENITAPCIIPVLEKVKIIQISAGCEHSGAISSDGDLFTWGHGDGGRLGHGDSEAKFVPSRVEALQYMHARPTTLHCGDKFTMIAVEPLPSPKSDELKYSDSQKQTCRGADITFDLSWMHSIIDERILSMSSLARDANEIAVSHGDLTIDELDELCKSKFQENDTTQVDESGDMKETNSSEKFSPTGRDILLALLSLMARSYTETDHVMKRTTMGIERYKVMPKEVKLAQEYCVEISVQLFQSLLVILTLQSAELFEADSTQSDHVVDEGHDIHEEAKNGCNFTSCLCVESWLENTPCSGNSKALPKPLAQWATIRCALCILRSNLHVLNDACKASRKKGLGVKSLIARLVNKSDNELHPTSNVKSMLSSVSEENLQKSSLSASGRLASLLGVSMTSNLDDYDCVRSSDDDDEEEDDDEDDEDDDDDDNRSDDDDEDDDDEDCDEEEDEEEIHMGNMMDQLHDDGYDDDDLNMSKDLLDEEAAKLARAVISMMDGGESDHEQEDHDHSFGDDYDLGKDLYDNEDEVNLNVEDNPTKMMTVNANDGQYIEDVTFGESKDNIVEDENFSAAITFEERKDVSSNVISCGSSNSKEINSRPQSASDQHDKQEHCIIHDDSTEPPKPSMSRNANVGDEGQNKTVGNILSPADSHDSLGVVQNNSDSASHQIGDVRLNEGENFSNKEDLKSSSGVDISTQHSDESGETCFIFELHMPFMW